jgi:hypothetical protein
MISHELETLIMHGFSSSTSPCAVAGGHRVHTLVALAAHGELGQGVVLGGAAAGRVLAAAKVAVVANPPQPVEVLGRDRACQSRPRSLRSAGDDGYCIGPKERQAPRGWDPAGPPIAPGECFPGLLFSDFHRATASD